MKIKILFVNLLALALLMTLFIDARAQDNDDKSGEMDKIFSWTKPDAPGCAVAVSQNGKQIVNRAYGSADLERNVPITPNTIFDAASVTKQFVAASIMMLVEEGKLSLTEDIRKYIPELPDYGQKITLDHLMTHTGGVRDWTGILPLTAGNEDALTLILRQRGLNFAPGEEFSYSNSGFVLLKEIVARTSKMTFEEFTRKRLFEPLGMKNTVYLMDLREIVKNRALAYEKDKNGWKTFMKLDNDRGGGGALLSTPSDLLIWNEALASNRLGAFVTEKLHEPAMLKSGRKIGYARGLFVDTNRGGKFFWHTGGSAGYSSLLSRYPAQNLSVAIMCNTDDTVSTTGLARRIFDLYAPPTTAGGAQETNAGNALPPISAEGVDVAGLDLNNRAGLYFSRDSNEPLRLITDRGRLRVDGGPALVAQSKERFKRWGSSLDFMSGDEFEISFLSPDEFEFKSMDGKNTRFRRAVAYAPTADDLKAFAGRYESDEIKTVFQIEPKENALIMRLEHSPSKSVEFKPVDRDTFQIGRMTVRFIRDKSEKIVALDYSNPVISNIKFTRLGDCQ